MALATGIIRVADSVIEVMDIAALTRAIMALDATAVVLALAVEVSDQAASVTADLTEADINLF